MPPTPLSLSPDRSRPELRPRTAQLRSVCARRPSVGLPARGSGPQPPPTWRSNHGRGRPGGMLQPLLCLTRPGAARLRRAAQESEHGWEATTGRPSRRDRVYGQVRGADRTWSADSPCSGIGAHAARTRDRWLDRCPCWARWTSDRARRGCWPRPVDGLDLGPGRRAARGVDRARRETQRDAGPRRRQQADGPQSAAQCTSRRATLRKP